MRILVTGGTGYIGSHMVRMLMARGHNILVLDSMEFGYKEAIPDQATLIQGNVGDSSAVDKALSTYGVEAVIHFAGYISVEESVRNPKKYFHNNLVAPIGLLEAMEAHRVDKLIFSSTAAVYGEPETIPIPEDHPKNPTNPYGLSKWCFEHYLAIADRHKKIRSISLRYFNAAGASLDGMHGEAHNPEIHIIPLGLAAAMEQKEFYLYGEDYPTKDGSCVRDYIHIEDLCQAHMLALDALENGHKTAIYNVGTGTGITNKEVIAQIKKETGVDFSVVVKARRAGDPAQLVADPTRLKKEFGWSPQHSDIATIVSTAWKWHRQHPGGYQSDQSMKQ